jgi:hypothetical protein
MKYVPPHNSATADASYVNGDPATASLGSIPPAEAFEDPQREIVNMITDSQQVPTDQDLHQMTRAIRDGKLLWCVDSGPLNTLQIPALMPILLSYTPGLRLHVLVAHTVTGPTTISIGSLNPTAVKRRDGSELQANDMMAGQVATLVCDGTFFQLQNIGVGGAAGGAGGQYKVDIPYVHDTGAQDPNQSTALFKNHLIGLFSPALPDINEGRTVEVKLDQYILGPTDFAPNNFPIHPVAHPDGSPIAAGDGVPNQIWLLVFDGVQWQLLDVYNSGLGPTTPATPKVYVGRSLQFQDPNALGPGSYPLNSYPMLKWTPLVQGNRSVWTQSAFVKWPVVKYRPYYYTAGWQNIRDYPLLSGGDASAYWGGGAGDFTGMCIDGSDQNLPMVMLCWAYSYAIICGQSDPEAYQSDMHPGDYVQNIIASDTKWHHLMLVADGAYMTCYYDSVNIARGAYSTTPGGPQGTINTTREHVIGGDADSLGQYYGTRTRLAEMIFIDGQALTWDKFAKVVNGDYVPIDNALNLGLTFGTNGFYLNWQDSSAVTPTTLGKDWSGNANNFRCQNFNTSQVYNDFPGNPTS